MHLLLLIAVFSLLPTDALAGYLDPGSGSTLVQGIIAFFAAISRFFRKIGSIFKRGES